MIRNQNSKGTFILETLVFKWMGYFSLCLIVFQLEYEHLFKNIFLHFH